MAIVHGGKMLKIIIEVEEFCKIVVADPGDHSVILHILRPYDILLALLCHSRGGGGCGMRPQVGCGRWLERDTTISKEGTWLQGGDRKEIAGSKVGQRDEKSGC